MTLQHNLSRMNKYARKVFGEVRVEAVPKSRDSDEHYMLYTLEYGDFHLAWPNVSDWTDEKLEEELAVVKANVESN